MKTILIIGAGHFGRLAAERLSQTDEEKHLIVADSDACQIGKLDSRHVHLIHQDGVEFLRNILQSDMTPDWIIPALPVHLAAEWCLLMLSGGFCRTPIPAETGRLLPNPFRGGNGDVYVSHAAFRCPDTCDEPDDFCTVTGTPRKENMFTVLSRTGPPSFTPVAVRSYQLAPGVGGYKPGQLFTALEEIRKAPRHVIFSTSCRCHGVMTGIRRMQPSVHL